jgi:hypothetical protein
MRWRAFEAWIGTWGSAAALFLVGLAVFGVQSIALPAAPGRDMGRYIQAYLQLGYEHPILMSVINTRGPLAALGVGLPLELGGIAAEVWLAALFAVSIVAWSAVAMYLGPRAALLTAALLLANPSYGVLFHGLASDALFAAAFAGWALLLARAIVSPSVASFAIAGLGMGGLVLVRPANHVLVVMTLLPLVLRAPWIQRGRWAAAFFVGSAVVTQGWKAIATLRYGDATGLRPSGAVIAVSLVLLALFLPSLWRRRLLLAAVPVVVAVSLVAGLHPVEQLRSAAQSPSSAVFLYRAFMIERIVSPENGAASQQWARVIERDLLEEEPYRSYGVDLDTVFGAGSDRIFGDVTQLPEVDLAAATDEAIRQHPGAFTKGIARTAWTLLRARAVLSTAGAAVPAQDDTASAEDEFIIVNGKKLPRPSEGQPIPASRFGPVLTTLYGDAREVWRSATDHSFVFDDPRDERRYARFERQTAELAERIPTRDGSAALTARLDDASRLYPRPAFWLALGVVAIALRRPRRSLVAIAPSVAALAVIGGTALVALPVPEYSLPVSPAFIVLAAAGLVGARSQPARPARGSTSETSTRPA